MTLRNFYSSCVIAFFAALTFILALYAMDATGSGAALDHPSLPLRIIGDILGVLGAFGASAIWIGMMLDCLLGKRPSKVGWLFLMLTINILAALIYYFTRYNRKQVRPVPTITV
jgi:hypothetical protein